MNKKQRDVFNHELLVITSLALDFFDGNIMEHPAIDFEENKEIKKQAKKISSALYKLYNGVIR